jgi:plasmid stability protein
MAQLPLCDLDDDIKSALQKSTKGDGRSPEEDEREILRDRVWKDTQRTDPLGKRLRASFGEIGLEEDIPEWRSPAESATF